MQHTFKMCFLKLCCIIVQTLRSWGCLWWQRCTFIRTVTQYVCVPCEPQVLEKRFGCTFQSTCSWNYLKSSEGLWKGSFNTSHTAGRNSSQPQSIVNYKRQAWVSRPHRIPLTVFCFCHSLFLLSPSTHMHAHTPMHTHTHTHTHKQHTYAHTHGHASTHTLARTRIHTDARTHTRLKLNQPWGGFHTLIMLYLLERFVPDGSV